MPAAKKTGTRARTHVSTDAPAVVREVKKDLAAGEVLVLVPNAFTLTDDDHVKHNYTTATRRMPRRHAEHWFAQAQGVQVITD